MSRDAAARLVGCRPAAAAGRLRWRSIVGAALTVMLACASAHAVRPDEVLDDPVLESRARALSAELRCLVCQNQSIDDSDAPLARDLRVIVRERLVAGESDRQIMDYLVARYGEFVLLKPRFGLHTLFLWSIAPVLLLLGAVAVFVAGRARSAAAVPPPPLTREEQAALERLDRD